MQTDYNSSVQRVLASFRLHLLLRMVMGGLLIYAGVVKMLDPNGFVEMVMAYEILPWDVVNIFALCICLRPRRAGRTDKNRPAGSVLEGGFPTCRSAL